MSDRPRPTPQQLHRYASEFNASPPMQFLGVRVSFPEGEHVRVELDVRREHLGGLGTDAVNGGVLAAMFDLALGSTPALVDPTRRTATMQLSMSFMRPATGDRVHVEARIDSSGAATMFSSASLFDAKGQLCARASGVIKLSKLTWATGSSPAIR